MWVLRIEPGSSGEQPVLLTAASLLQPHPCRLLHSKVVYRSQTVVQQRWHKIIMDGILMRLGRQWQPLQKGGGLSNWEEGGLGKQVEETYPVLTFLLTILSYVMRTVDRFTLYCRKARSVTFVPMSFFLLVGSLTLQIPGQLPDCWALAPLSPWRFSQQIASSLISPHFCLFVVLGF